VEETLLELKEDYTLAIVTHSMQQASRISDRTAFMLNGDLVEMDNTKKIFLNPEKQETEDYIAGKFG
jgi:ABC-type phosphate transport system, ATPase component